LIFFSAFARLQICHPSPKAEDLLLLAVVLDFPVVICEGDLDGWPTSGTLPKLGAHLRDGFIVAKVGNFRGSENPDNLNAHAVRPQSDIKEKVMTTSSPSPVTAGNPTSPMHPQRTSSSILSS
jgi:hypothetical protein